MRVCIVYMETQSENEATVKRKLELRAAELYRKRSRLTSWAVISFIGVLIFTLGAEEKFSTNINIILAVKWTFNIDIWCIHDIPQWRREL